MAEIEGYTADGAAMMRCPVCNGTVFLKALWVGVSGDMRGLIGGMCANCKRGARLELPTTLSPSARLDDSYYQQALTQLAQSEPQP